MEREGSFHDCPTLMETNPTPLVFMPRDQAKIYRFLQKERRREGRKDGEKEKLDLIVLI